MKFSFKNSIICFVVITFFLVLFLWLIKSGNLKSIAKTIALDSAFINCPFGASETSAYKFIRPEGIVSLCIPIMNIAYSKGYYLNEGETVSTEEVFNYASEKKEQVLIKEVEELKSMPIIMVKLMPKSNDGYLINDLVYVKNTSETKVDIISVMSKSITYKINKASKGPQVLILHTHATEAFNQGEENQYKVSNPTKSEDNSKNVVAVGKAILDELESNGVKAIQSTIHHDTPDYNNAYNNSFDTAKAMLKKYPTIKVVLDIHRDSMINEQGEKYRPVVKIGNKNAAQIMFVAGIGTKKYANTHWEDNLKTILLVQKQIEQTTPGLCRPTLIRDKRYNSQVANGAMLIEIGTCGNTLDEAIYGGQLMAKSLAKVINGLAK